MYERQTYLDTFICSEREHFLYLINILTLYLIHTHERPKTEQSQPFIRYNERVNISKTVYLTCKVLHDSFRPSKLPTAYNTAQRGSKKSFMCKNVFITQKYAFV